MHVRGVKIAKRSEGNVRRQAVILPARAFRFESEAILASTGFDPFCPGPRWQALEPKATAAQISTYSGRLPPCTAQNGLKPRTYI
jgi:hypothetical protein